jgi:hypothetical protein
LALAGDELRPARLAFQSMRRNSSSRPNSLRLSNSVLRCPAALAREAGLDDGRAAQGDLEPGDRATEG